MQGLVLSGANNFFAVRTPEGNVVRCSIKGKKLKERKGKVEVGTCLWD